MKVSELNPPELDYWVAKAEGLDPEILPGSQAGDNYPWRPFCNLKGSGRYRPTFDWSQGGPIMEREWTNIIEVLNRWARTKPEFFAWHAPDVILKNFMRAWVASVVGEEVGED